MDYNKIKAIPTSYNGVKFRSRLEASWAAFFDIYDIKWEYEPFELDGWFPDFKISNPQYGDGYLLVEVKPTDFKDKDYIKKLHNQFMASHDKETLLLGISPDVSWERNDSGIGLLLGGTCKDLYNWYIPPIVDTAILNFTDHADICAHEGSFGFRFSHEHDGDHHLKPVSPRMIMAKWKQARNVTQWRKK